MVFLPKYTVEIETNGTIVYDEDIVGRVNQFNCSPKLKTSNQLAGCEIRRDNEKGIKSLPLEKTIFKFVISNKLKDMKRSF